MIIPPSIITCGFSTTHLPLFSSSLKRAIFYIDLALLQKCLHLLNFARCNTGYPGFDKMNQGHRLQVLSSYHLLLKSVQFKIIFSIFIFCKYHAGWKQKKSVIRAKISIKAMQVFAICATFCMKMFAQFIFFENHRLYFFNL